MNKKIYNSIFIISGFSIGWFLADKDLFGILANFIILILLLINDLMELKEK